LRTARRIAAADNNIQRCHREHLAIVSIRQSAAARSEVSLRSGN